jgi:hypothetical protein
VLPHWSTELRAAKHEDSSDWIMIGHAARLFDVIRKVAPTTRHQPATAILRGRDPNVSFFLNHFQRLAAPVANRIWVEVFQRAAVEDRPCSDWAHDLFEALIGRLPIRYANARLDAEYSAKNMIEDESSAMAIGANIVKAIPGLYWLNYFGDAYVKLIGQQRLLSAPAYEVNQIGGGVLIGLDALPDRWTTAEYREREQRTIAHLGEQFFFSRHDPQRKTVAPDFAESAR